MPHRSLPPSAPDLDPFWHDAFHQPPPWWERVSSLVRPLRSWLLIAGGVVLVAAAGWWLLRPGEAPVESSLPMAEASSGSPSGNPAAAGVDAAAPGTSGAAGGTTTTGTEHLIVQAAGAVREPGVYTLPVDARVDDLVDAAGGLSGAADLDRVNLAAPVADGERVWVPTEGEDDVPEVVAGVGGGGSPGPSTAGGGSGSAAATPAAPVDLNTASAEELDSLPGVGPATATAILAYRDQNGQFASVDELLEVRGIGDAKLEQLRPLVRV